MRAALWLLLLISAGAALAVAWLPEDGALGTVQTVDRGARTSIAKAEVARLSPAIAEAPVSPSTFAPGADAPAPTARSAWPAISPQARQAWTPPPPPPAAPPPPVVVPPPAPPPAFPYQWLGQIEQEGELRFFIAGPQRTLAVRAGDVVDERWHVNGVDAGRLLLTWLPTDTAVTVAAR